MKDPRIGDRVVAKATRERPAIHGTIIRLIFMEHTSPKKMASGPKDGHPDIELRPDTHDDAVTELRKEQWKLFPRNYVSGLRFYSKDLELENVMDRLAREA
jgi:hypothetical protein